METTKCPSSKEWISKMWHTHTKLYCLAIKRWEVLIHVRKCMNSENMLSGRSQAQRTQSLHLCEMFGTGKAKPGGPQGPGGGRSGAQLPRGLWFYFRVGRNGWGLESVHEHCAWNAPLRWLPLHYVNCSLWNGMSLQSKENKTWGVHVKLSK